MLRRSVLMIPSLVVALASCAGGSSPAFVTPSVSGEAAKLDLSSVVTFRGGATLAVAIADDDDERRRGLMGVADLPEDGGMAFVWDAPEQGSFWMKDTLIPLSIAFVDEGGRIVTIREMVPCAEDPCPLYGADAAYTWAVEADAGWFAANGVSVGDMASLEASP